MRYSLDASVLVAWLLPDQRTTEIEDFWERISEEDELVCAMLLLPECTSTLRRKVFEKKLEHTEAQRLIDVMTALPIRVSLMLDQFPLALNLANSTGRAKAYDMQYLAVAEVEGCHLITLDSGMRQAAIERRVPVTLLR